MSRSKVLEEEAQARLLLPTLLLPSSKMGSRRQGARVGGREEDKGCKTHTRQEEEKNRFDRKIDKLHSKFV